MMMDISGSGRWALGDLVTSRGLDNGCQVNVYLNPSGTMSWPGYMNLSWGRGLPGGPDIHPGIDAGVKSFKKFTFWGELK